MPMYDYQCGSCKGITTRYRKIAERNDPLLCVCGSNMNIAILRAPAAQVQPECHYVCPVTGEQTTSWRQRKNTFAKHGLVSAADPDQQKELMQKGVEKRKQRENLAKNYLPQDLREKLTDIGASGEKPLDRFHVG